MVVRGIGTAMTLIKMDQYLKEQQEFQAKEQLCTKE